MLIGKIIKKKLPWRGGAKCDRIIGTTAGERARGIVVGVTIRSGTCRLKHLRVYGWVTGSGCVERAAAAVFGTPESIASALARAAFGLELHRAVLVQIR